MRISTSHLQQHLHIHHEEAYYKRNYSNGLCERHNYILTETLLKIKEEGKCDWETALAWAISAKNSFINVKGFSPYQLVFGRNVSLPSVVTDKPPALEGSTESRTVAEHLTALHSARKTFVAVESSEKIRRALRRQTRSSGMTLFKGKSYFIKEMIVQDGKALQKLLGKMDRWYLLGMVESKLRHIHVESNLLKKSV